MISRADCIAGAVAISDSALTVAAPSPWLLRGKKSFSDCGRHWKHCPTPGVKSSTMLKPGLRLMSPYRLRIEEINGTEEVVNW
jgi:hypothetical protein